ncbi:MAG: YraN family protein [Nocardiaceae bacterium]|nr:YraN family protein [Nocardiaceae bacterium]
MATNQNIGTRGEDLAVEFLEAIGLQVLDRNWRCRHGELDVVAADGSDIVFVEVKTRTGDGYGRPEEAVTPRKQQRLRRLAGLWLSEQTRPWRRVRFDVVGIRDRRGFRPTITHTRGAF